MADTDITIPITNEDLSRLSEILARKDWGHEQFLSEAIAVFGARDRAQRFASIAARGQQATREKFGKDLTREEIAAVLAEDD